MDIGKTINQPGRIFPFVFEDANEPERVYSNTPNSQSPAVFNWTTVRHNFARHFRPVMEAAVKSGEIMIIVQLKFGNVRWYSLRARPNSEKLYIGIAVALPSECVPPEIRSSKRTAFIESLYKNIEKLEQLHQSDKYNLFRAKYSDLIDDK